MKLVVLFLTVTSIFFGSSAGVRAQNASDTFQIGNKQIVIPAPSGFTEAASHIREIKAHFLATEAEGNDFLASHLPNEDYGLLKKGETIDLTYYTKVSVSKRLRDLISTGANFADFVEAFKKGFPALSDPNGSQMKNTLRRVSEDLTDLNKEKTTFYIDKPYNLGEIVNDRNSFGIIILSQIKTTTGGGERTRTLLTGLSAIRVREKIIFVYTYKNYKTEGDIADLKNFTNDWLKQIAAANK